MTLTARQYTPHYTWTTRYTGKCSVFYFLCFHFGPAKYYIKYLYLQLRHLPTATVDIKGCITDVKLLII